MAAENVETLVESQHFMELSSKKKKSVWERNKLIRKKETQFRGLKR